MLVPKLRFNEFTDEWNSNRLNDIAMINPKNSLLPDKFIYIDLESVEKGILKNKKVVLKEDAPSRAQRNIKINDILFQTVRPYQQNNLFINNIKDIPYVASTGYALLRTNENPYFIYLTLHQKKFLDKVMDKCTGTSFPAISSTDLGVINIHLPSIKEQEKIANTLQLLDKKIELQSQKIEALKLYKKGLNKTIFSQEGISYSINELIKEYNEKSNGTGKFKILSSTMNGIYIQSDYFNKQAASDDTSGYKIIPKGYITYRSMSDTGEFHFNEQNIVDYGIVSPAYPVFKLLDSINKTYFINYLNNNNLFKASVLTKKEGGTRYALSLKKLKSIKVTLPSKEKQQFYGKLIEHLRKKEIYEFKKIEKLTELKQGLMQKLFI